MATTSPPDGAPMRLDGYKRDAVGALVNHWTRHSGDPDQARHEYRNSRIDATRTSLNYALMCDTPEYEAVTRAIRTMNDSVDRRSTAKTNVVSSAVVTLPKGWPAGRDPREFFEAVADVLTEQVGRDNVVGGFVHMDETTPHMHFAFVARTRTPKMEADKSRPLRWTRADERKNPKHRAGTKKLDTRGRVRYERVAVLDGDGHAVTESVVSQAAMFDRARLKTWHDDTAAGISRRLGFEVSLRLGEDEALEKALSSVPQTRLDEARKAATEEIAKAAADAEADRVAKEAELAAARERLEGVRRDLAVAEAEVVAGVGDVPAARRRAAEARDANPGLEVERDELARRVAELEGRVSEERARAEVSRGALERCRKVVELLEQRAREALGALRERVTELGRAIPRDVLARAIAGFSRPSLGRELSRRAREARRQTFAAEAAVGRGPKAGRDDIPPPYEVGMMKRAIAGGGVAGREGRRTS